LKPSFNYGMMPGMGEMRKITVEVPNDLLERLQDYTGAGVTETVRTALKRLDGARAQKELLKLRGKVNFSMTWQEMKYDRE
jgi:hypothetical protein